MITEDQLEQLAIQWFQDTGWSYLPGPVIAPEGATSERDDFRAVILRGRLAEAIHPLNPIPPEPPDVEVTRRVAMPEPARHRRANSRLLLHPTFDTVTA
jgi:type I restriction enzyme R subunit